MLPLVMISMFFVCRDEDLAKLMCSLHFGSRNSVFKKFGPAPMSSTIAKVSKVLDKINSDMLLKYVLQSYASS